jgi:hypothetical protein
MPQTPAQVRAELAAVLALDLIGPSPDHPHAAEQLSQPPSRWYLTGFLVPYEASEEQKVDPTSTEEIASSDHGAGDDAATPEQASARRAHFPSSMGISVLVPEEARALTITVSWGDYRPLNARSAAAEGDEAQAKATRETWQRTPRVEPVRLELKPGRIPREVPSSGGLRLVASVRTVPPASVELVPPGTRSVSVFLVNDRPPNPDARKDERFIFQAALRVEVEPAFVARPDLRGRDGADWDDQVADLQYRSAWEYAVGHGVATRAELLPDGSCRAVETTFIPTAQVEKVIPGEVPNTVELGMEALGRLTDRAELALKLRPLVLAYDAWLEGQKQASIDHANRKAVAAELLRRARTVRDRIARGIELLSGNEPAFEAFCIANRAMAKAARRRSGDLDEQGEAPRWRPFQLAFLLMNLRGMVEPTHPDREVVDLLFFPTGGGKTEAYLGLAAFTLVLRRLENPGLASAGVSVLMRYTLRLLTLDQLGRAATLICALELLRQQDMAKLGPWPFEIGLWVGRAATPNRIGKKGDNDKSSARARAIAFQNDDKKPSPIPLESCPWCNTKFSRNSFVLLANGKPNPDHPTELRVTCSSRSCTFRGDRPLPIVAVDDAIYRRLPSFLIATVDKFASLPWVGHTGALFGKVDRADKEGFYGPCDPGRGLRLPLPLLPPDLVIQDELHLISGPLGTMVGLYETVLDALSTRSLGTREIRPKVVASTATVRRAEKQIVALFTRQEVEIFPPPGPDLRDSYFAKTVPVADPDVPAEGSRHARLYMGVAAQGRSLKVVLLRTTLALMAAAQRAWEAEGGARKDKNPADPYMTLLGYFNSLRELGGSRRIVEDEVRSRLVGYRRRTRMGEGEGPFADRTIAYDVVELTSRESTSKVADAKRRLGLGADQDEHVDVALATNMISVGLDITRLGLMVVLGQPKTAAEYIQATSRVGRDDGRPGLVVTLLNVHRPRDRSHYERFEAFHASFYRAVEATSVTPFASRAVDRGLAAITVALARHGLPELTPPSGAIAIGKVRTKLDFVGDTLAARYAAHDKDLDPVAAKEHGQKLAGRVTDLLDEWVKLSRAQESVGAGLQYQREEGGAPPLLHEPLDKELAKMPRSAQKFKAQRSLRDVEPSVNLWVRSLDGIELEEEAS